jgi:putative tricarboxylic transport membrane protein
MTSLAWLNPRKRQTAGCIVTVRTGCYAFLMGRLSRPYGDLISGGLLAGLGVFILTQARNWTYSAPDGPGPGFFPLWYGVAMIALSLVLVVKSVLKPSVEEFEAVDRHGVIRSLSTWAAFAVAVALLKPLGFLVSFASLTFFIVAVVFRRPVAIAAATAVAAAAAFYITFPLSLSVPLPTGYLGF